MNVYCLSVHLRVLMIQQENHWTNLDEIWYRRHVIAVDPKIALFNFLQLVMSTWLAEQTYEVGSTLPPLNIRSYIWQ
jgi:hypothetical protein